jgi:hypothetical protein
MHKEMGVQVNKQKAGEDLTLNDSFLLRKKSLKKGRNNYY